MKNLLFAATVVLLFGFGCYHYEPQFEGPYEDGDTPATSTSITYEILTVENGQIHLYHKLLQYTKVLSNLPPGIEKASINYSHDRIAYQIPGENIAIVDSAGLLLGTVSNSTNAEWFDWHTNNRSLCVLNNFQLSTWGDQLSLPITNLLPLFPFGSSEREMPCATVTADGSVVVAYRDFAGFNTGYECKIVLISPSGSKWVTWVGYSERIHWLRADGSGKNILFGVNGSYVWKMDVDEKVVGYDFSADFCVRSPQADRLAIWTPGELHVSSAVSGDNFFSTGTATITALDW